MDLGKDSAGNGGTGDLNLANADSGAGGEHSAVSVASGEAGHSAAKATDPENKDSGGAEQENKKPAYYQGKFDSIEKFEQSYREAEGKLHSLSEENAKWQQTFQVFQPILDAVAKNPEWEEAIRRGLLPSQFEELPDSQKGEIQIKAAIEAATKPLLTKIAQLEQKNNATSDTLEEKEFRGSLNEDDAPLYDKYKEEIQAKRRQYQGMGLKESFQLVVPYEERERMIKQRIERENEKKKSASVGNSSTPPGTGADTLKKKMSVAEAFAFALKKHKPN